MPTQHKLPLVVGLAAATVLAACAATSFAQTAPAPAAAAASAPAAAPVATPTAAPAADGFDTKHAQATFEETCGACHETGFATSQRHDRAGWQRVIDTMYGYGLSTPDETAKEIVEYLTRTYPEEKS